MTSNRANERLLDKLETIKELAQESEALLRAQSPDVEKLLATLHAQAELQQALLEKLLTMMNPTKTERELSDTFQAAVQELLEYFQERVRFAGKKADAAALKHLRKD